jgi:hypothetical protein
VIAAALSTRELASQDDHWDFADYEEAFASFYRMKPDNDSLVLVISTDAYVSGYWLEKETVPNKSTHVYRTLADVKALHRRVGRAIATQKSHALGFVVL